MREWTLIYNSVREQKVFLQRTWRDLDCKVGGLADALANQAITPQK